MFGRWWVAWVAWGAGLYVRCLGVVGRCWVAWVAGLIKNARWIGVHEGRMVHDDTGLQRRWWGSAKEVLADAGCTNGWGV